MIDFGLSKRFISPQTGNHIEFKKMRAVVGTLKFLSYNAESGDEQCRRDDLVSVIHIMIYFLRRGELPWDAETPKFD